MLRLDWATYAAARFACENWHYSRSLPTPPLVKIGVWERDVFIGCVIFGRGANSCLYKPYGLESTEGAELVRVALNKHETSVTRIVAIAIRLLRKKDRGLRLLVSFADPSQGHVGGIYQGGGWIYTGQTSSDTAYIDRTGKRWHSRMISSSGKKKVYGQYRPVLRPSECRAIELPGKHRYLMPLDAEMRAKIEPLRRPYPKTKD